MTETLIAKVSAIENAAQVCPDGNEYLQLGGLIAMASIRIL